MMMFLLEFSLSQNTLLRLEMINRFVLAKRRVVTCWLSHLPGQSAGSLCCTEVRVMADDAAVQVLLGPSESPFPFFALPFAICGKVLFQCKLPVLR